MFSWSEIKKHNNEESCWVVIHGNVHDLTNFLEEHPGGKDILLGLAGGDGTQCFDDIGHSDEAKALCKRFRIGSLQEHPGGEEVLLEQLGKDATEAFEDVGHSTDARDMMKKYKIGELAESERSKKEEKKATAVPKTDAGDGDSSWKSWLLPIAIGLLATVAYRFFFLSQDDSGKP
ncbi:cytochrome b5-like isoform X2 [Macrosteles quadrilineatus]|uniref:cytochrome b5-like isoform X2 n=1 Tax=Macrosteles quadrilineatus TaxID=74068 RepID=UPI0023E295C5|nr:cytochrome b5-like isoform X2 [Macrosteles quadrilineatus]